MRQALRRTSLALLLALPFAHALRAQSLVTPSGHWGAIMLPERQPTWFITAQFLDFTRFGKEVDAADKYLFIPYNDMPGTVGFNIVSFTASNIVDVRHASMSPLSYRRTAYLGWKDDRIPEFLQNRVIHLGRMNKTKLRRVPRELTDTPDETTPVGPRLPLIAGFSDEYFLRMQYHRNEKGVEERVLSPFFVGGGYGLGTINYEAFIHAGFDPVEYRFPRCISGKFPKCLPLLRAVGLGGMARTGVLHPSAIMHDLTSSYINIQAVPRAEFSVLSYPFTVEYGLTASRGYFVATRTPEQLAKIAEYPPGTRMEKIYEAKTPQDEFFSSVRVRIGGFTFEMYNDSWGGKDKGPSYGAQVTYRLRHPAQESTRQDTRPDSSARTPR